MYIRGLERRCGDWYLLNDVIQKKQNSKDYMTLMCLILNLYVIINFKFVFWLDDRCNVEV